MRVDWTAQARDALYNIIDYISDHNISAAIMLNQTIEDAVEWLPTHPYIYKKGRAQNTREMIVHPNYLVVYRVTLEAVEILDVLHARQQYPKLAILNP